MPSRTRPMVVAGLLVALTATAGCTSPDAAAPPDWGWPNSMAITTTALEPNEFRGAIQVAWGDDALAAYVEMEDGMPRYLLATGGALYTSGTLMGWTQHDAADLPDVSGRAYRYATWDLPRLWADAAEPPQRIDDRWSQATTTRLGGIAVDVAITPTTVDASGTIQAVRIETSADPESPYTARATGTAMPFSMTPPAQARPAADIASLDGDANRAHVQVIQWLRAYADQNDGRVPATVDADALLVQRIPDDWPDNPYDGQPLRTSEASGHFQWTRCGDRDAVYHGYGWDGSIIGASFGSGCP